MINLELALGSFWQLARHWKMGDTAKLELTCEGGNLQMNFSAKLGHPDLQHFQQEKSPPSSTSPFVTSPPLSCKRKTPSQLRRQERRRRAPGLPFVIVIVFFVGHGYGRHGHNMFQGSLVSLGALRLCFSK